MSKNKIADVNAINESADNDIKEPTLKKVKHSQDSITNFEDVVELKGGLIPIIRTDDKTGRFRYDTFQKYYSHFQVLFLPNDNRHSSILPGSKTINNCESNNMEGRESSAIEENDNKISSKDVASLFDSLDDIDKDSWCVENNESSSTTMARKSNVMDSSTTKHLKTITPQFFLSIDDDDTKDKEDGMHERRGYCSFIIQNKNTMRQVLPRLPISDLPVSSKNTDDELLKMRYGPCIWFFFGRNNHTDDDEDNNENSQKRRRQEQQRSLDGRPEHTDSVTHDGTWHFQLSGQKIWHLRPTKELLQMMTKNGGEKDQNDDEDDEKIDDGNHKGKGVVVECKEGDVLVINTRLWWHRTEIPPQPFVTSRKKGGKISVPSISYARDFYLPSSFFDEKKNIGDTTTTASKKENTTISGNDGQFCIVCDDDDDDEQQDDNDNDSDDGGSQSNNKGRMTNVDAMYAANDIEENTIVFTEKDMPDCEMHRSDDPNCMLVEDDNGLGLIVSVRSIKAGEFLSIAKSDDEDEGSYEEVVEDDGSFDDGSYE